LGMPQIAFIALVSPARPDASTGSNASELHYASDIPVLGIPRGGTRDLSFSAPIEEVYAASVG
jgi:hypothetical protein